MQSILTTIILICLTHITTAQNRSFDTTFKNNKHTFHIATNDLDRSFILLTSTYASRLALHDTIESEGLGSIELPDFNNDGYADILITYLGNNPTYFLYLFDTLSKKFKSIKDYMSYPDALQLKSNSKYYYSYYRAGCADMNWVSDLFKIVNFKIVQVGHIEGQGCDSPLAIKIYKVINNSEDNRQIISKLSYLKYIGENGNKWDFIKKYWNKHYRIFD